MKNNFLKIIAVLCLLLFSFQANSQTNKNKTTKKVVKKNGLIEKTKVPKVVTETFIMEYPSVVNEGWYGYPYYDFNNDWYGYDPYLYETLNPEFYIVEYSKDNVSQKAIYSKAGKRVASHKSTIEELPMVISDAIKAGAYSTWTVKKEKEVMFRDTELDKVKVYKIVVVKGNLKHQLFYSTEGTLLKDKVIK
jgi:hypothetical protein